MEVNFLCFFHVYVRKHAVCLLFHFVDGTLLRDWFQAGRRDVKARSGGGMCHISTSHPHLAGKGWRAPAFLPDERWHRVSFPWDMDSHSVTPTVFRTSAKNLTGHSVNLPRMGHFVQRQRMKNDILGKTFRIQSTTCCVPETFQRWASDVLRHVFNSPLGREVSFPSCVSHSLPPQEGWPPTGQGDMLLVTGPRKLYRPLDCLWLPETSLR